VTTPASYTEEIPTAPGYYVYRFWADGGTCLYVGRVGNNGPRPPQPRFRSHRRSKTWWPDVARIEIAELPDHPAIVAEEAGQIEALRPLHNVQRANCTHDLSLPGAVKHTGQCSECARKYQLDPARAVYEASPARKASARERGRKRLPSRTRDAIRKRRPTPGQAPLWGLVRRPARSLEAIGRAAETGTRHDRSIPMFKRTGKHARPRFGPLFALEALLVALSAKREMSAAAAAQLGEMAQDGARG